MRTEIGKDESPAVGEVHTVIVCPTPRSKGRIFESSEISPEGILHFCIRDTNRGTGRKVESTRTSHAAFSNKTGATV